MLFYRSFWSHCTSSLDDLDRILETVVKKLLQKILQEFWKWIILVSWVFLCVWLLFEALKICHIKSSQLYPHYFLDGLRKARILEVDHIRKLNVFCVCLIFEALKIWHVKSSQLYLHYFLDGLRKARILEVDHISKLNVLLCMFNIWSFKNMAR